MHDETCFGLHREPLVVWTGTEAIAVVKPAGMHSAPGRVADGSSLAEWVFQRYPEAAGVVGRSRGEGGLLHRLDRDTEGLVLFALTDGFFTGLATQAAAGNFMKSYLAKALPGCGGLAGSRPLLATPVGTEDLAWKAALRRGELEQLAAFLSGSRIEGRFRPYGPGSRRVACSLASDTSSLKAWTKDLYQTMILSARPASNGVMVDVRLSRGFRHQVRAHLAWLGLSLEGDSLYGEGEEGESEAGAGEEGEGRAEPWFSGSGLKLLAYGLSFKDPVTGRELSISLPGL